ncbi:guided entry of tail-anchored proteins factor 1-like [Saccoglossus kowalevskii]|uniref:Guided entry of tail-anchored proteins factor 1 n=1 Tax=Saccoglossus kowalevskii TaxID=10224 RepID=A0ABM0LVS7_SACKO|nr:PREDICTED: tail-anchored protein insertion receptor WRB-like [Saccoglossus kowalevskii]
MSASIVIFVVVFMLCLLHTFTTFFVRLILAWLEKENSEHYTKLQNLKELQRELSKINAKNEFAKYARTQRKMNKLTEDLADFNRSRSATSMKYRWCFTGMLYCIQALIYIYLIWTYYKTPIIKLDPDWLYPLATFIAIPTGIHGAVGITCWLLICNKVSKLFIESVR